MSYNKLNVFAAFRIRCDRKSITIYNRRTIIDEFWIKFDHIFHAVYVALLSEIRLGTTKLKDQSLFATNLTNLENLKREIGGQSFLTGGHKLTEAPTDYNS